MANIVWSEEENRNQNNPQTGQEIPGDTDAPDIVGRTGEEMPEVAHDEGPRRERLRDGVEDQGPRRARLRDGVADQGRDEINDAPDGDITDPDIG